MPKPHDSQSQEASFVQLSLPLYWKPFLETRKKVRSKNARKAFDMFQEGARILNYELENGGIQSVEAKAAIRDFLAILQGAK
jgi:hypothetical protein